MTCPVCTRTSPADTSTNMQISELPSATDPPLYIRIGDRFRMRFDDVIARGFKTLGREPGDQSFSLLLPWHCPNCNTYNLWARVEFQTEGEWAKVVSIKSVDRSPETLDDVDAVSNLIVNQYAFGIQDWVPIVAAAVAKERES